MMAGYLSGTGGKWENTKELEVLLAEMRKVLVRTGHTLTTAARFSGNDLDTVRRLLMGFRTVGVLTKSTTVPVADVDRWLRQPLNGGRGILEVLAPLANKPLADAEAGAHVENVCRDIVAILPDKSWVPQWLEVLRSTGTLARHSSGPHLRVAARVLALLPADGVTLTELVERATGDTKALRPSAASTATLRALSLRFDTPFPTDAGGRRRLWARAGVVVDSMSSRVLLLGVRASPANVLGRWLDDAADDGMPFVLNAYQLERYAVIPTAAHLYVCENPAVLEAAARELGSASAALICTEGQPSVALAELLRNFDGQIHWRGDFDWTGLRTTASAIDKYGATPWRMDAATYRNALTRGNSVRFKQNDYPAASAWDPELASAMTETDLAVMEERVIDELISDLDTAADHTVA